MNCKKLLSLLTVPIMWMNMTPMSLFADEAETPSHEIVIGNELTNMSHGFIMLRIEGNNYNYQAPGNYYRNGQLPATETINEGKTFIAECQADAGYHVHAFSVCLRKGSDKDFLYAYSNDNITQTDCRYFDYKAPDNQGDYWFTINASFRRDEYTVTIPETEHGIVTYTVENAPDEEPSEGPMPPATDRIIHLDIQPDTGYALSSLTAKYYYGGVYKSVDITDNQFIMPCSDVTVTAEFAKTVSATLDFGAAHTEYAQYYADKAGYAVDGSKVTATVEADDIWALYDALYAIAVEDHTDNPYVIDAGECLSNVGLKPIEGYENEEEYDAEWQSRYEQTVADGQTYYVQWLKPLDTTYNIVFTQPLCGTEVTTKNYGSIATNYSDPAPEYTVNGVPSPDDQGMWYAAYDSENQTLSSKVEGQMMGGTSYYTRFGLERPFGYYFTDDFGTDALTFENCEIKAVTVEPLYARVIAEVTAQHNDYGDSVVNPEPTADAAGIRTYYCDCGAQCRTEEVPAGIYQVNIADSISNGSISADKESTFMSDTVTVNAVPDSGFRVERLYYVSDGTEFDITKNTDGKYTFEMPEHDVTVYAVFDRQNAVLIEFGEGHENAAAMLSSVEGCTVTDTTVKYYISDKDDATYGDARAKFDELFYDVSDRYTDNDQLFRGIALNPISYYTNESELSNEEFLTRSDLIGDSVTFYVLWADPISELTITAPSYKCGQQLTTRSQSSTTRFEPCEVGISEGLQLLDYYLFYTNWEISGNSDTVLQGGNSYNIYGFISTPWDKYIPADADIHVAGGTLSSFDPSNSNKFRISVLIPHDTDEDGICTVCGESVKCISATSVTLADDLALNFYVNGITDENADQYTIGFEGECLEDGQTVALEKNESTGRYYAAAHVTARNTGKKITATLYQGDEVIDTADPYSVTDYLADAPAALGLDLTQIADWTDKQKKTYAIIAATQLFCDAASDYFNGTSQFDTSYEAYAQASGKTAAQIDNALAEQTAQYPFVSDENVFISLSLKNKTKIYIYEGDEIVQTVEGLLPQQLTQEQSAGGYTFYGLSWAERVFAKQTAGTEISQKNVNMAKAVTAYAIAANAYQNA